MKGDGLFLGGAAMAYGVILLAFAAVEDVLARGLWKPFDIASYYGLASSVVGSFNGAIDLSPASPLLPIPAGAISGYRIYAIGLLALACAVLVLEIGRRSYGNASGFLAGLLFTLNIAWALGHLTIGEALALVLVLLSARLLLATDRKYYAAGLCTGAAACFNPLALLALPGMALFLYRRGDMAGALSVAGTALVPPGLFAAMALIVYGAGLPAVAAAGGFEAAGFVAAGPQAPPDALMAIANIVMAACMLASLLPLALLGFSRGHGRTEEYFLVTGLCFVATLALKQYLHYWFVALPFLALLCVSVFRGRRAHE